MHICDYFEKIGHFVQFKEAIWWGCRNYGNLDLVVNHCWCDKHYW